VEEATGGKDKSLT
jgi:WD40 repeat protein